MDSDGLPLVGAGVDWTAVDAIEKKRLVAFLNHYVISTVKFLNKFSCVCEEKLAAVSNRILRLEATLSVLEDKLSSIPGLENIGLPPPASTAAQSGNTSVAPPPPPAPSADPTPPVAVNAQQSSLPPPPPPPEQTSQTPAASLRKICEDSRFAKYFKMLSMGVPAVAVKLKMKSEGADPDLLDTPDAPAPPSLPENNGDSSSGGGGSSAEDSDSD